MEVLQKEIIGIGEVKGFDFNQVFENDKGYIYQVNKDYFEVFLKKTVAKCIDFKKRIYSETEFKEIYPKAKDFGIWAWSLSNLNDAKAKIK